MRHILLILENSEYMSLEKEKNKNAVNKRAYTWKDFILEKCI